MADIAGGQGRLARFDDTGDLGITKINTATSTASTGSQPGGALSGGRVEVQDAVFEVLPQQQVESALKRPAAFPGG